MRTPVPLVLACVAGCTVFSGWDDLRGGKRTTPPTPPGEDGGPVTPEPDAAVVTDAAPASGKCTVASCSPLLCCREFTSSGSSCAQSCGVTAVEMRCGSAKDCEGSPAGPICCIASPGARLIAECANACPTGFELCDPAVGCPSPKQCAPGSFGVDQCQ